MDEKTEKKALKPNAEKHHQASMSDQAFAESNSVFFIQRKFGNQGALRHFKAALIQTKLSVSDPGDIYEHEADQVADTVMRMSEPQLMRVNGEEETHKVQISSCQAVMRKITGEDELEVNSDIESKIRGLRGGGNPLPVTSRNFFEPRMGQNFGNVRIHTDAQASEIARAVNAKAFTVGNDVVFRAGQYEPDLESGKRLLAHELTHVVQQEGNASNLQSIRREKTDSAQSSNIDALLPQLYNPFLGGQRQARAVLNAGKAVSGDQLKWLIMNAKELLATDPKKPRIIIAYYHGDGSETYLGPNNPCVDDKRLLEIKSILDSSGIPDSNRSIVDPPSSLDTSKTSIVVDLYDGMILSVTNDYINSAPEKRLEQQAQTAIPATSSRSLSEMLSFKVKIADKEILDISIPKSITVKLPIILGTAKSLRFEFTAEASKAFSFSMILDGVIPYFKVSFKGGVKLDDDKGTIGTLGLVFDSTKKVYKADNPEVLKQKILSAGEKLKAAGAGWNSASFEDKEKKLIDMGSAIGDMYDAITAVTAPTKTVPAFSVGVGVQNILSPGKDSTNPDPSKQPEKYLGVKLSVPLW